MAGKERLLTHCAISIAVDVEYPDRTLVTHTLLGDTNHLVVILAERNPLDGSWEFPGEQALARLYGPKTHCVVSGAADEESGLL